MKFGEISVLNYNNDKYPMMQLITDINMERTDYLVFIGDRFEIISHHDYPTDRIKIFPQIGFGILLHMTKDQKRPSGNYTNKSSCQCSRFKNYGMGVTQDIIFSFILSAIFEYGTYMADEELHKICNPWLNGKLNKFAEKCFMYIIKQLELTGVMIHINKRW